MSFIILINLSSLSLMLEALSGEFKTVSLTLELLIFKIKRGEKNEGKSDDVLTT